MKRIAALVVGSHPELAEDVASVICQLSLVLGQPLADPTDMVNTRPGPLLEVLLRQCQQRFLGHQAFGLQVFRFDTLEQLRTAVSQPDHPLCTDGWSPELFFADVADAHATPLHGMERRAIVYRQRLIETCQQLPAPIRLSPASITLYVQPDQLRTEWQGTDGGHQLRCFTTDRDARQADVLRSVANHLEHKHVNRLLNRGETASTGTVSLARYVADIMAARHGDEWDVHAYTGSVVSAFIDSMTTLVAARDRILGGPNEHSLACGALAGWHLHGRGYVIVVTSGMSDEFKGTLANLQRAMAPGLIVCAEASSQAWHPFQGTVGQEGDSRAVVRARGLPCFYVETPNQLQDRFVEVAAALHESTGPVVIFATPSVLESRTPAAGVPGKVEQRFKPRRPVPHHHDGALLDKVVQRVNDEPHHLLWQCGRLDDEERTLAYRIAAEAGIALCDSLAHPGSVAGYCNGSVVPNYLGTLGIYGYSRRVHAFLHGGGELHPRESQSLFFIKSRIDQAATPFPQGRLARQLRVVQVNRRADHLAPFAELALCMPSLDFLQHVSDRLDVRNDVLQLRMQRLTEVQQLSATVPSDRIPTSPMTPNYFYHRLQSLIEQLIEECGYRYTGVFDVGRGDLSAIRNLPRTGPGYSGWYGRALMGDAQMALPYICLRSRDHVLAFIGDGARSLVPDNEHHIVSSLTRSAGCKGKNATVFYLANGLLSIIQSYIDVKFHRSGGPQVAVPTRWRDTSDETHDGVHVHRSTLTSFDEAMLEEALLSPARVNFFDVLLTHTTDGDGMNLLLESDWSRQACEEEPLQ